MNNKRPKSNYIPLEELEIYKLSRKLSKVGWAIYEDLHWRDKKIMGDQFIEATDSVGANIAEGYGRYHQLDQIKFYYNSRGSLKEANKHWLELLRERDKVDPNLYKKYKRIAEDLRLKLNNFISSTYKAKDHFAKPRSG